MLLNTAAQVLSLARKLEEDGAAFYEALAQRYPKDGELLLGYAQENKKNITQVERAYYEVISDALEGTFAFSIETVEFESSFNVPAKADYSQDLNIATSIEEKTEAFYLKGAEQSLSLLGDVPRAFTVVAKKRAKRLEELRVLS